MQPTQLIIITVVVLIAASVLYFKTPELYKYLWLRKVKNKLRQKKATAITFDDGPGCRLTPNVLEVLEENNAKATFFLTTSRLKENQKILKQISTGGHQICSHGQNHQNHYRTTPGKAIADIKKSYEDINSTLGKNNTVYPFRPPYGKLNLVSLIYLTLKKIPIIYWTFDCGDTWPIPNRPEQQQKLKQNNDPQIFLLHDNDRVRTQTEKLVLDSVRQIISTAKQNNMNLVTIEELLS